MPKIYQLAMHLKCAHSSCETGRQDLKLARSAVSSGNRVCLISVHRLYVAVIEVPLRIIRSFIQEGAKFKNVWAPKEIVHGIYRTVAIAIARGNADIIASNLRKALFDFRGR